MPAFVLGLVMSGHYAQHRREQERMRVVAFAFLTPFFFLKGGMSVSTAALWANLGILGVLFAARWSRSSSASTRLPAGSPHSTRRSPLCSCRRTDLRDDQLALRAERGDHRPDAVFASDRCRRALRHRPDGDRAALLPAACRTRVAARPRRCAAEAVGVDMAAGPSSPPPCHLSQSSGILSLFAASQVSNDFSSGFSARV
jgi:hypothetical protein